MTFEPGQGLELTTTGTGGRSARLIALGVLVVLGGVVYVGISGQNQGGTAAAVATPARVAVATVQPTPAVSDTPSPTSGQTDTYPGAIVVVESRGTPSDTLGVSVLAGGQRTVSSLDEGAERQFHTGFLVPLPVPQETGLEVKLIDRSRSFAENAYDQFTLPADDFNFGNDPLVVVDVLREPHPFEEHVTALVRNGYRMVMTIEPAASFAVLLIDVSVGAEPVFPNEHYDVVAIADGHAFTADIDSS
jgi:hypothetical protein